jgi:hypothetical protein
VGTETVGNVSNDPGPILELNPEHPIGQGLENPTCSEIGRLGHERLLYPKRHDSIFVALATAPAPSHQTASLCLRSPAPAERVRMRGPSRVIATVCSKYADSEPSDVHTVQPSGLM